MLRALRKVFLYGGMFAGLVFHPACASGGAPSGGRLLAGNSGAGIASHVMVPIAPGTFRMGSPLTEPDRGNSETQHTVTITKGFLMGKYPVTQELYQAVMGSKPSYFSNSPESGEAQAKRPVERVSWYDALVFCNRLSAREGLTPVYSINGSTDPARWGSVPMRANNAAWDAVTANWDANGYRLPTEAEWEYACRAGTATAYNLGDTWSGAWGWYGDNSGKKTHEAGKKAPNAWGLHDMHGNVWEWVWDWWDGLLGRAAVSDPRGAASGTLRVLRGGGWRNAAGDLRSAFRGANSPYSRNYNGYNGFRLVRNSN